MTGSSGHFSTGMGSDHRLVDGAVAFENAVDGNPVAGPYPQLVSGTDVLQRDLFVRAVGTDSIGGSGRKSQQGPECPARALARLEFQDLADEYEHDDHGGRFEIDGDLMEVRHSTLPDPWRST